MSNREIIYISKGHPVNKTFEGNEYHSGIWKNLSDQLDVGFLSISGDSVANHVNHGGKERVVCYYPYEHYTYWKEEFGQTLTTSAFGENITGLNMKEDEVCVGDIFQVGEAILQVSQGRFPCVTINKRNNNPLLLKRIIETGYTGYFFRVLKEGRIKLNSEIKQLSAHPMGITVSEIHHLYFHKQSVTLGEIDRVLNLEALAEQWKKLLIGKKSQLNVGEG
ncbi:MOSC domain-containing protein [Litchfieldia salsa]|uniref:MOSC domain-containing protein YiiM n=1 Tax=Litchfieldia salsa TaxID=930152 RepID=A0A1H0T905_9BACI|nr:MOSC domain-containing protein [Litchfieldia salsa]SDP50504.1 MOSC domain-containing protein YiiM [Litchfieldia salsa]